MGEDKFCGECGEPILGGKFCTACGTPSGIHRAITPEMAAAASAVPDPQPTAADGDDSAPTEVVPPAPPAADEPRKRGAGRWALIGGAAVALMVVAVVASVVLTSGGEDGEAANAAQGPDPAIVYQQQVAKVFGPVLGANEVVSEELTGVRGTSPEDARLAVRRAQEATTQATGALSALAAPAGQEQLAADAKQVITREKAYLAAVVSVLNHPTVAGASQLQALESDLTAALTSAGPAVAGEDGAVSGATRLTAWARTTSRTLNRRAAAKRARVRARARTGGGGGSAATANRGTSCGGGLYAGPNTSCSFARNVRDAYWQAPGSSATVRVHSPVTDQTYSMSCAPSGDGVSCSGGNDASVSF